MRRQIAEPLQNVTETFRELNDCVQQLANQNAETLHSMTKLLERQDLLWQQHQRQLEADLANRKLLAAQFKATKVLVNQNEPYLSEATDKIEQQDEDEESVGRRDLEDVMKTPVVYKFAESDPEVGNAIKEEDDESTCKSTSSQATITDENDDDDDGNSTASDETTSSPRQDNDICIIEPATGQNSQEWAEEQEVCLSKITTEFDIADDDDNNEQEKEKTEETIVESNVEEAASLEHEQYGVQEEEDAAKDHIVQEQQFCVSREELVMDRRTLLSIPPTSPPMDTIESSSTHQLQQGQQPKTQSKTAILEAVVFAKSDECQIDETKANTENAVIDDDAQDDASACCDDQIKDLAQGDENTLVDDEDEDADAEDHSFSRPDPPSKAASMEDKSEGMEDEPPKKLQLDPSATMLETDTETVLTEPTNDKARDEDDDGDDAEEEEEEEEEGVHHPQASPTMKGKVPELVTAGNTNAESSNSKSDEKETETEAMAGAQEQGGSDILNPQTDYNCTWDATDVSRQQDPSNHRNRDSSGSIISESSSNPGKGTPIQKQSESVLKRLVARSKMRPVDREIPLSRLMTTTMPSNQEGDTHVNVPVELEIEIEQHGQEDSSTTVLLRPDDIRKDEANWQITSKLKNLVNSLSKISDRSVTPEQFESRQVQGRQGYIPVKTPTSTQLTPSEKEVCGSNASTAESNMEPLKQCCLVEQPKEEQKAALESVTPSKRTSKEVGQNIYERAKAKWKQELLKHTPPPMRSLKKEVDESEKREKASCAITPSQMLPQDSEYTESGLPNEQSQEDVFALDKIVYNVDDITEEEQLIYEVSKNKIGRTQRAQRSSWPAHEEIVSTIKEEQQEENCDQTRQIEKKKRLPKRFKFWLDEEADDAKQVVEAEEIDSKEDLRMGQATLLKGLSADEEQGVEVSEDTVQEGELSQAEGGARPASPPHVSQLSTDSQLYQDCAEHRDPSPVNSNLLLGFRVAESHRPEHVPEPGPESKNDPLESNCSSEGREHDMDITDCDETTWVTAKEPETYRPVVVECEEEEESGKIELQLDVTTPRVNNWRPFFDGTPISQATEEGSDYDQLNLLEKLQVRREDYVSPLASTDKDPQLSKSKSNSGCKELLAECKQLLEECDIQLDVTNPRTRNGKAIRELKNFTLSPLCTQEVSEQTHRLIGKPNQTAEISLNRSDSDISFTERLNECNKQADAITDLAQPNKQLLDGIVLIATCSQQIETRSLERLERIQHIIERNRVLKGRTRRIAERNAQSPWPNKRRELNEELAMTIYEHLENNQKRAATILDVLERSRLLAELDQQLLERIQDLAELDERFTIRNQQLADRIQQIVEPVQQMLDRTHLVTELDQQCLESNQLIKQWSRQISGWDDQCGKRYRQLARAQGRKSGKNDEPGKQTRDRIQKLADRDKMILERIQKLAEYEEQILECNQQLSESDQHLLDRNQLLAECNHQIAEQRLKAASDASKSFEQYHTDEFLSSTCQEEMHITEVDKDTGRMHVLDYHRFLADCNRQTLGSFEEDDIHKESSSHSECSSGMMLVTECEDDVMTFKNMLVCQAHNNLSSDHEDVTIMECGHQGAEVAIMGCSDNAETIQAMVSQTLISSRPYFQVSPCRVDCRSAAEFEEHEIILEERDDASSTDASEEDIVAVEEIANEMSKKRDIPIIAACADAVVEQVKEAKISDTETVTEAEVWKSSAYLNPQQWSRWGAP